MGLGNLGRRKLINKNAKIRGGIKKVVLLGGGGRGGVFEA